LVFTIRFGARMRRAIKAKKFGIFLKTLPLIIRGTKAFCNGFSNGIKSSN